MSEAKEPSIELYGTADCPFTAELREQLMWEQIDFVEYDVEQDEAARERLVKLTQQRTVPVLVENGEVKQVGWHGQGCIVAD